MGIFIKTMFILLGCAILIFTKYMPFKAIEPNSTKYRLVDKNSYITEAKKTLNYIAISYICIGVITVAGFDDAYFMINIPLIPCIIITLRKRAVEQYIRRI